MIHKIHSGRDLHQQGENYVIWGNSNSKHDYSEVGFPQPTRNCAACHTASNPLTPQGDNWKTQPSKEACLSCHLSSAGSTFNTIHVTDLKLGATAAAISNSTCASCHGPSSPFGTGARALGAGTGQRGPVRSPDRKRDPEDGADGNDRRQAQRQVRHRQPRHRRGV